MRSSWNLIERSEGFSLIEVLVATLVLVVGVLSTLALVEGERGEDADDQHEGRDEHFDQVEAFGAFDEIAASSHCPSFDRLQPGLERSRRRYEGGLTTKRAPEGPLRAAAWC